MGNPFTDTVSKAVFVLQLTMPDDWHGGHWFSGPGWYFADETEQLVGPYDTREVAQVAMYRYCQSLELYADEIADAEAGHPYPTTDGDD